MLAFGAYNIILYDTEDFTHSINPYDIIFVAVGKTSKRKCARLLEPKGKSITVGGLEYATETSAQLIFLRGLYEKGKYKAIINRIYFLDEIVNAQDMLIAVERKVMLF